MDKDKISSKRNILFNIFFFKFCYSNNFESPFASLIWCSMNAHLLLNKSRIISLKEKINKIN